MRERAVLLRNHLIFQGHQITERARHGGRQETRTWVEIWEQREHCGCTGVESQTHLGMREVCVARCSSGNARKLITVKEFHELLESSKEQ